MNIRFIMEAIEDWEQLSKKPEFQELDTMIRLAKQQQNLQLLEDAIDEQRQMALEAMWMRYNTIQKAD